MGNQALEEMYEKRRNFLTQKHGFAVEKELWHGTSCKAISELLTHGLQPPSDIKPSDECPVSGGKGLCTTLCGSGCHHCRKPHAWDRCHMYGLGVYLADLAQKSHRYVREPGCGCCSVARRDYAWQTVLAGRWRDFEDEIQVVLEAANQAGQRVHRFSARGFHYEFDFERMVQVNLDTGRERPARRSAVDCANGDGGEEEAHHHETRSGPCVYSMLRCRVCLGNPYLIEGNLLKGEAMHNMCRCQDPTDALETSAEAWGVEKGHEAFYVRGLAGAHKAGLGVHNSEYIIFQPYQILPLYQVDYVIE